MLMPKNISVNLKAFGKPFFSSLKLISTVLLKTTIINASKLIVIINGLGKYTQFKKPQTMPVNTKKKIFGILSIYAKAETDVPKRRIIAK